MDNYKWIFSGIGGVVFTGLITLAIYITTCVVKKKEIKRKKDKITYEKIIQILPNEKGIYFLREHNFAGFSFSSISYDEFYTIVQRKDDPDLIFLDKKLEKVRKNLFISIFEFLGLIGSYTVPLGANRQTVDQDLEFQDPKQFNDIVNKIQSKASEICGNYDKLVKNAKDTL